MRVLFAALTTFALMFEAHANAEPASEGDDAPTPAVDAMPSGPFINYREPSVLRSATTACSMHVPLCVIASALEGASILRVLRAAETAWETLIGALGLPPPDVDPNDGRYSIFIPDGGVANDTFVAARDTRSAIDRARGFTILGTPLPTGCALDAVVARELARAVLLRVAPATPDGIARAQTSAIADLLVPCASASRLDEIATFQAHPQSSVCEPPNGLSPNESHAFMNGASLFWSRIDWAYGKNPGAITTAAWALAPTTTAPGASRWNDEPDAFDVLRTSFKNALTTGSTLDDLLVDTAVARAFMGPGSDVAHQPETRAFGEAARIALDWEIDWPAKPRRLAAPRPVAPTGASYVVIRHRDVAPGARLRVEIVWEEHALFRWTFVKIDEAGRELGRVPIPTPGRATEAQMTLVDLDRVDRVLLVGVNVGDPAYRFDPDDETPEPHGFLVTLAAEN